MITLAEFLTHAAAMVVGAASLALGLWAGGRLREWWTDGVVVEEEVVERLEKEQREQRLAGEDWQPGEDMRWPDRPAAWAIEDPTFPGRAAGVRRPRRRDSRGGPAAHSRRAALRVSRTERRLLRRKGGRPAVPTIDTITPRMAAGERAPRHQGRGDRDAAGALAPLPRADNGRALSGLLEARAQALAPARLGRCRRHGGARDGGGGE
jgi:hypothetical protein